ncbi:MAG: enoyl-CoA hydratase/isomerase family protein [Deltaproteobacteria bacterium]|nr:MAG: enoyl-CoA hydratase/isomerase family protein [Deltaproteobacteria bacterium]
MSYRYIRCEKENGMGWIRMNRPDKLNALNAYVFNEIEKSLMDFEEDDKIKVIVISGNEKAFCAGADVDPMANADIVTAFKLTDQSQAVFKRLSLVGKPTIAAISGYALGGGLELALCCDFRIAAENAVFGFPEINLGLIPGGGGTQRLPRLVGEGRAMELILLGENINAQQAENWGLVNKVVPIENIEVECRKLANKLIEKSSIALRCAKNAIRTGGNVGIEDGLKIEQDAFCLLFGTVDQKEGIASFLEKRKPVFIGR